MLRSSLRRSLAREEGFLYAYVYRPPPSQAHLSLTCIQDAEDRSVAVQIQQALVPAVRLELLPKSTIDIFVTVIENDGIEGCIAAGSVAASAALADAGIEMLGLVASCSAVCLLLHRSLLNN